jgi:Tol biopolymer transport system component
MTLPNGTRVGAYEILGTLGAGGMGEVYVAEDTKLRRKVALKVLPESLADDPERLARLQHEAEVLASLNHPNIGAIHGVDDSTRRVALVMELVEGAPLSDRLRRNGLPLQECLKLAVQIAAGLEAAHKAGVIHRDLKPANIIVSPSGTVKIVDFGLAKRTGPAFDDQDTTTATPRTAEGQVLGTVAYMSPEQAEGRPIDPRSDVFSFGTVLYEMVTGTRPFRGDTSMSTIASILQETPKPPSEITLSLPHDVDRLILRCLRKDPDRRFQTASDLRLAVEDLREDSASSISAASAPASRSSRRVWRAAAVVALAAIAATAAWILRRPATPAAPVQLRQLTFEAGIALTPALSPDGRLLAYASDRSGEGPLDIWLKQVAGGDPVRLTTGPGSKVMPQFTADGTRILYLSGLEEIYEVPTLGGGSRLVIKEGGPFALSPRGEIAYVRPRTGTLPGPVLIAPATGGPPTPWQPECVASGMPAWSPDGSRLAFAGRCGGGPGQELSPAAQLTEVGISIANRSGGVVERLGEGLDPGILLPRLAWAARADTSEAMVVPRRFGDSINLFHLNEDGTFRPLTSGTGLEHWPVVSPQGELVFTRTEVAASVWSLPLTPGDATPRREVAPARMFGVSRDESKLVFGRMLGSERGELVLRDRTRNTDTVLATHDVINGGAGSFFAHVSPDGKQVAYRVNVAEVGPTTFIVSTEGGATRRLSASMQFALAGDWTPDGTSLIGECRPTARGICFVDPVADTARVAQSDPKGGELLYPSYSWDGRWITFMLRRGTATVIAVTPVRPDGSVGGEADWVRVSPFDANAGRSRFSPDGSAIFYLLDRGSVVTLVRQALEPRTKQPVGAPVALTTVTAIRPGLLPAPIANIISVSKDRVFFNLGEAHGNVWLTRLE